jgi:glutamate formiminotransferase
MPRPVECVPNFSEGRDASKIDAIVQAILAVPEVVLLDREADADHNRSVLTLVDRPVWLTRRSAPWKAGALIDLTKHRGAPRIGAADVVPFIPIEGVTVERVREAGRAARGGNLSKLKVPVYLYEAAARSRSVPTWKISGVGSSKHWYRRWAPWRRAIRYRGRGLPPPTAAPWSPRTQILIAYNVNLNTPDVSIARRIAKTIRFSSGGFRYEIDGRHARHAQSGAGPDQPYGFRADADAPGL